MTMQKVTGVTLWLGSIAGERENPVQADIGLTINELQYLALLDCLKTGADINIRLTPKRRA